jgi:hypothetical protein
MLESAAGRQVAVLGSYCVNAQMEGGCADTGPIHPEAVTVAQPGEELTFSLEGARVVRAAGCHASDEQGCIGTVAVRPLGCERRSVSTIALEAGSATRWTADLDEGTYELDVFAYFETKDGRTGDVSGSLGLLVGGGPKKYDALGVIGIKPAMQVCPFAD